MKRATAIALVILAALALGMSCAKKAGPEIGIVLPTMEEPRWIQDRDQFQKLLKDSGYKAEILFSGGNSATELSNVETFVNKGVKAIIICPHDSVAAAAAADAAAKKGIKVVSYDRLIRETANVDYYVTFDSVEVGAAWGKFLVQKAGSATGANLYLYAGAASDNNAFLFFEGAWSVLQPKIADGTFRVINSSEAVALKDKAALSREEMGKIIGQVTTNWDFNDAKRRAEANLVSAKAADKGTVFICAPNDGTARAIADAFAADKDVKTYWITGQDAEKASIQYIIEGKQSMTVLKDTRVLAADAITAALAFVEGKVPAATKTYNNGVKDVPAKPTTVITVTKDNVKKEVVDSGYWPASEFSGL